LDADYAGSFEVAVKFCNFFVLEFNHMDKINTFEYFKKRLGRIAVPYIFWSLIYYFFVYSENSNNLVQVLLKGNASYQLYFIPALCVFYLLFPLLHYIYKFIANRWVLVFLGAFQIWLLNHDYIIHQFKFADPVRITILAWFFFLIGMVAAHNKEKILAFAYKFKAFLITATTIAGIFVLWQGVHDYLTDGSWLNFYSQWRPGVFVYTLLLGVLLFSVFERKKFKLDLLEKLSGLSFFTFFVHVIVLETFWLQVGVKTFEMFNVNRLTRGIFDTAFFVVVSIISFGVAFAVHKIPKLYKITG